jgi:pimeloyl-ACP methyl ester carboxylesterase
MPRTSLYRSEKGEAELRKLYDQALQRLSIPTESRMVDTRYGATHILEAGPQGAPPLVILHGAYASAPSNLAYFLPLVAKYRIYAPDTVGHSVRSAQAYLSPGDNSYGWWVEDVLDGLGLGQVPCISSSFGAGILLRTAVVAPERISKAVFMVPSGIANGSMFKMASKLFLPWLLYFLFPSQPRLVRACMPMMSEMDEDFLQSTAGLLRHVRFRLEGPKLTTREELSGFSAPTLIFVAEEDIFFPSDQVIPKAREIFPNLAAIECLPGRHLPAKRTLQSVNQRIDKFLYEGR